MAASLFRLALRLRLASVEAGAAEGGAAPSRAISDAAVVASGGLGGGCAVAGADAPVLTGACVVGAAPRLAAEAPSSASLRFVSSLRSSRERPTLAAAVVDCGWVRQLSALAFAAVESSASVTGATGATGVTGAGAAGTASEGAGAFPSSAASSDGEAFRKTICRFCFAVRWAMGTASSLVRCSNCLEVSMPSGVRCEVPLGTSIIHVAYCGIPRSDRFMCSLCLRKRHAGRPNGPIAHPSSANLRSPFHLLWRSQFRRVLRIGSMPPARARVCVSATQSAIESPLADLRVCVCPWA